MAHADERVKLRRLHFGGAVLYLRWARGWSQKELAQRMQCAKSFISMTERGVHPDLRVQSMQRFADALEVSMADLLTVAEGRLAAIFSEPLSRAIAKKMPLRRCDLEGIQKIHDVCRASYVLARERRRLEQKAA